MQEKNVHLDSSAGSRDLLTASELRRRRRQLNVTQQGLAVFAGLASNYLSRLERGECPITSKSSRLLRDALDKLEYQAKYGGEPQSIQMDKIEEANGQEEKGGCAVSSLPTIPVVGMAAACNYDPSLSNLCDLWELSSERVPCICDHSEGLFGLRISGDSMEPVLKDGDIVAVSDSLPATGNLCVAMLRTDGVVCKRWYWRNGVIRLEALNTEGGGRTYEWTKEEFKEEQPLVWRFKVESLIYRKLS